MLHKYLFYNHPYRRLGVPTWYHTYEQYKERYWQYVVGWYWQQLNELRKTDPSWFKMSFASQMQEAEHVAYNEEWKRYTIANNYAVIKQQNQETKDLLDQQWLPIKNHWKTFWQIAAITLAIIFSGMLLFWR